MLVDAFDKKEREEKGGEVATAEFFEKSRSSCEDDGMRLREISYVGIKSREIVTFPRRELRDKNGNKLGCLGRSREAFGRRGKW